LKNNQIEAGKYNNELFEYPDAQLLDKVSAQKTAFDELVGQLDQLNGLDPAIVGGIKEFLNPLKIGFRSIKGVYGELKAIKRIRANSKYIGAQLKELNNRVDYTRKNQQGIDSVWKLSDGRSLYVEAKNWGLPKSGTRNLTGLKNQFEKHMKTLVGKHITRSAGITEWLPPGPPVLHYDLRGKYFDGATEIEILSEFTKIIESSDKPPFELIREILNNGGSIKDFLIIDVDKAIMPPLST